MQPAVVSADISLLTVKDSVICAQLAPHFKANSVVSHRSGTLDSLALAAAQQQASLTC